MESDRPTDCCGKVPSYPGIFTCASSGLLLCGEHCCCDTMQRQLSELRAREAALRSAAQAVIEASEITMLPDKTGSFDWWYTRQIAARRMMREVLATSDPEPLEAIRALQRELFWYAHDERAPNLHVVLENSRRLFGEELRIVRTSDPPSTLT